MAVCPTRMILESFLAGALHDRVEEEVVTHVDECPSCQGKLEDLVGGSAAKQRPAEPDEVATFEFDPAFLKRLRETLADLKSYRPLWIETSQDPIEFTGMNLRPRRARFRAMRSSASWAGVQWGWCTRPGITVSHERRP